MARSLWSGLALSSGLAVQIFRVHALTVATPQLRASH